MQNESSASAGLLPTIRLAHRNFCYLTYFPCSSNLAGGADNRPEAHSDSRAGRYQDSAAKVYAELTVAAWGAWRSDQEGTKLTSRSAS